VHLVGFIIRVYHDARSSECQIWKHYRVFPDKNAGFPINICTWGIALYSHSYNLQ